MVLCANYECSSCVRSYVQLRVGVCGRPGCDHGLCSGTEGSRTVQAMDQGAFGSLHVRFFAVDPHIVAGP